jgi:LEA14-like dessication related protein
MNVIAALAVGLSLASATACSSVQVLWAKPEIQAVSLTVTRLDLRQADLKVEVFVANDASVPVTLAGYAYELQIDGQPFVKGMSETGVELSPQTVTTIQIPVSVPFADLIQKLQAFKRGSDPSYRFAATLNVETFWGGRTLSVQKEGRLQSLLR